MPKGKKPKAPHVYCSRCKSAFKPRFEGQKAGKCDGCLAFDANLRAVHKRPPRRSASAADEDFQRRVERMTCRVGHY